VPRWLLLDYGQVLCTAPPADEWAELQKAAGFDDPDLFYSVYWEHREAYDRGDLTADQYWDLVAPGGLGLPDPLRVRALDLAIWTHPMEASVRAARQAAEDKHWRLALFSNAPLEVADAVESLDWLDFIEERFFSGRIRRVKPEPEAYRHVLRRLAAKPEDVLFFDDRPDNVHAARALGLLAEVFTDPAQLEALPTAR
jgi:putative hydrolase of the HAD superfamily